MHPFVPALRNGIVFLGGGGKEEGEGGGDDKFGWTNNLFKDTPDEKVKKIAIFFYSAFC